LCALVLPTPYDAAGTAFTSDHPTRAELKRVQALACSAAAAAAATAGCGIMKPSDAAALDIVLEFLLAWPMLLALRATAFPNDVPAPLLDFSPASAAEQSLRTSVGAGNGIVARGSAIPPRPPVDAALLAVS
jgi:hypothetical protein